MKNSDCFRQQEDAMGTLPQVPEGHPCYQMLREKERELREYKFKYETSQTLFNSVIDAMEPARVPFGLLTDVVHQIVDICVE